ncbi:Luciferase-like monooxygenase [Beutenbergia cavernae DSM 12333]|uniref:Luciferase-like monooxygenase n=1 Tax=Beutenbergia cavernae (strain ATCC BAA-8 / DSM 12333 / CCUG 43141 / JCM 11478 / NBRC 16432 / NCIMB 13614 / HKI 0122) TaxID=471853 RepID=C5C5U8_BEUC1|nr:LLM class F420-dependent oxidoreductase [Beutenbergia cavernae]ACQ82306.1 Luciferase-like monooxygenase [Beutenbergia cavernae DSM 12333]
MRLGLQIPDFTWAGGPKALGSDLARVARTADDGGFGYLAVMDHFFQIGAVGPTENDMLEAYTTLGFLAAHTEHAKLLTVITGVHYRHPGVLAKTVTTLDVLSGGRAILGVGAGWNEEESRGLGIPFPPLRERFELLEDTLRLVTQMWAGDEAPFQGTHVHAERPLNVPQALSTPHPPIMVGGGGEKKTLRLVAQYAQACNLFNTPDLSHKLEVLRAHCDDVGRDHTEITKTAYHVLDVGPRGERTAQLIDELGRLRDAGIDDVIGGVPDVATSDALERLAADVVPVVATF